MLLLLILDLVFFIVFQRSLLEKRLQDTREQLTSLRTQSNDKISTLGSLVRLILSYIKVN